jgi:hypothetical protein
MWTSENRLKYNRDKLRYPSDLTDDECRTSSRVFHRPNVADGSALLSRGKS